MGESQLAKPTYHTDARKYAIGGSRLSKGGSPGVFCRKRSKELFMEVDHWRKIGGKVVFSDNIPMELKDCAPTTS